MSVRRRTPARPLLDGDGWVCSVTPVSQVDGGGFDVAMLTGTGTCTLTASQSGDSNYTAATNVSHAVVAAKADQATLTVTAPAAATFGDADATIMTSGGSGTGAVSFDAGGSTACSIASGKLHVESGTGTCSITATKASDNNYKSTSSAASPVTINKADPGDPGDHGSRGGDVR